MRGSVPRTSVIDGPEDPNHRDTLRGPSRRLPAQRMLGCGGGFGPVRATATHNYLGTQVAQHQLAAYKPDNRPALNRRSHG
jgi:hypothetical protein